MTGKVKKAILALEDVRQKEQLAAKLQMQGMAVEALDHEIPQWLSEAAEDSVLISDNRELIRMASGCNIVCVGVCGADDPYFEGADLVAEEVTDLDREWLDQCFCHARQIPVEIAQTKRLCIRELSSEEVKQVVSIAHSHGMEMLQLDPGTDFFTPESLRGYIAQVYALYGYGIWGVWLKTGRLIGCCGLTDTEMGLELQYMLDPVYQKQGYGQEMCRAVLEYAADYLEAEEILVRMKTENHASYKLARRLGFEEYIGETKDLRCMIYSRRQNAQKKKESIWGRQ